MLLISYIRRGQLIKKATDKFNQVCRMENDENMQSIGCSGAGLMVLHLH